MYRLKSFKDTFSSASSTADLYYTCSNRILFSKECHEYPTRSPNTTETSHYLVYGQH